MTSDNHPTDDMGWETWDDAFDYWRAQGCKASVSAYRARLWQENQPRLKVAVRDQWDYRQPETLDDVVSLLRRRIVVHTLWRDWLSSDEPEAQEALSAGTGTPQSNQRYIDQYEAAIRVVEAIGPATHGYCRRCHDIEPLTWSSVTRHAGTGMTYVYKHAKCDTCHADAAILQRRIPDPEGEN